MGADASPGEVLPSAIFLRAGAGAPELPSSDSFLFCVGAAAADATAESSQPEAFSMRAAAAAPKIPRSAWLWRLGAAVASLDISSSDFLAPSFDSVAELDSPSWSSAAAFRPGNAATRSASLALDSSSSAASALRAGNAAAGAAASLGSGLPESLSSGLRGLR
ncbi:hypothetical protein U9M48_018106 [Paspalum notatum var. saurae]|uniref:Uncharacterized protein n=1 Tax=Paspalum notatum var. saurae TaxID=547442 RepID=A0AAQ3WPG3_PASNO